jgi:transglutaminase-like putative cysteine protease
MYLQLILFFQKKDVVIYWQLAIISLLQVVVAAGFNHGAKFGILLVLYMIVGMSALALSFLYSQWSRYQRSDELPQPAPAPVGCRWPLLAAESAFSSSAAGSSRAGIVAELFMRLTMMAAGVLVLTLVIFFTVPRLGRPAWKGALLNPKTTVGFSDTVKLGDMGQILESREEVMRVQLFEQSTDRPYPVQPQIYIRGAVVTHYDNRQWSDGRRAWQSRGRRPYGSFYDVIQEQLARSNGDVAAQPPDGHASSFGPVVTQKIKIEPLDRPELFCIWPVLKNQRDAKAVFDPTQQRLYRSGDPREQLSYTLGTTAFADGKQVALVPCNDPGAGAAPADRPDNMQPLLQVPRAPHLIALARQWLAASGLDADDRVGRARLLMQRLSVSEKFQYSLEPQQRDRALDPIEDFIVNHPRGHCEFFATALALMLRSQGIPARVVLGYKCDEWNKLGKFYQVRQSDAHAWVEAYLAPRHIAPDMRWDKDKDVRRWSGGAWLRLDPTPAARDAAAGNSPMRKIEQGLDWIDSLWSDYVMDMDRRRQEETIYQPAIRAIKQTASDVCDLRWWRGLLQKIGNLLNVSQWNGIGGWLLHVGGPLLIVLGIMFLAFRRVWRAGRRLWRRMAARAVSRARRERSRVEFYHRFETLLARKGLVRGAGQTPREFARTAAARIATISGRQELALLPETVVEAFYRVRFGGLPLDNPQTEAVEHGLAELQLFDVKRSEDR